MADVQHEDGGHRHHDHDQGKGSSIVISGISGRFPQSKNIQQFQDNLFYSVDMMTCSSVLESSENESNYRWPSGLYGLPGRTGQVQNLDKFDAQFFHIHAKQAHAMDPQIRMLMEVSWEAILDAGINPETIRGSKTGVYVGCYSNDSDEENLQANEPDEVTGYGLTGGGCRGMFAHRLSFAFDLKGPSFALDASCSSSLLALDQAVAAIRLGVCDAALVAGVSGNHLNFARALQFHRLGMLSPDGRCKAFDADGDGFGRSEAVVAIYIQKKQVALRSYATIVHTKTNTDGFKPEGITFPSGQMQKRLLQETYAEAKIDPTDVTYIECHGTGTKVGDPQEVNAIAEIFCKNRTKPLLIGSVKSNMGHSEAAAGLCGIAKILIAAKTGVIPANLHFNTPNPEISSLCQNGCLKVVNRNTKWDGGTVGVTSIGFGGTNVHVILQTNFTKSDKDRDKDRDRSNLNELPLIIPFSGRTKETVDFALRQLLSKPKDIQLTALLHQISRRDILDHNFRGYAIIHHHNESDQSELSIKQINQQSSRHPEEAKVGQLWFIFSGMGSQSTRNFLSLMKFPIFAQSIQKSAAILSENHGDLDLLQILMDENEENIFSNVKNCFVVITAVQIALLDLLTSFVPDFMIGHSLGELACAYCDGCLSSKEALLTAQARGEAILETNCSGQGAMACVGLSWEEAKFKSSPKIFPACKNEVKNVTLSGPKDEISEFVEQLKTEGIFATTLNSANCAFHSPYIEKAGVKFREKLEKILNTQSTKFRSSKWISSSMLEEENFTEISKIELKSAGVDYYVNNLLAPVLFQDALEFVQDGSIIVEIGPSCILQTILKGALRHRSRENCVCLGLTQKIFQNPDEDSSIFFFKSMGQLYQSGLNPNFTNLYDKVKFPVSANAGFVSPLVAWDHTSSWHVPKYQAPAIKKRDASTNPSTSSTATSNENTVTGPGSSANVVTKSRDLVAQIQHILGLDGESTNFGSPLSNLGIDSIQIVQVRSLLEQKLRLTLGPEQIKKVTLHQIKELEVQFSKTIQNGQDSKNLVKKLDHIGVPILDGEGQMNSIKKLDMESSGMCHKIGIFLRTFSYYWIGWFIIFLLVIGFLFSLLVRFITYLILMGRYLDDRLQMMSRPFDAFLASNPQTSNTIMIFKLRGDPDLVKIKQHFLDRVVNWETDLRFEENSKKNSTKFYKPYDQLRWILTQNFLLYFWRRDLNFSLDNHFFLQKIEVQEKGGDCAQFLDAEIRKTTEFYLNHDWDGKKPQWEIRILAPKFKNDQEEKMAENEFSLIFIFHHCYGDGVSLSQMIRYAFADQLPPAQAQLRKLDDRNFQNFEKNSFKMTALKRWLGKFYEIVTMPHFIVKTCARIQDDYRYCGPLPNFSQKSRRHCRWRSFHLARLRSIKNSKGKSVPLNALILSILSTVYQKLYAQEEEDRKGKKCPRKLLAMIPYAPYPYEKVGLVNNFAISFTAFRSNLTNDRDRLDRVEKSLVEASTPRYLNSSWITSSILSKTVRPVLAAKCLVPKFPILFTNVPFGNLMAPDNDFSIFGGHRVNQMFALGPFCFGSNLTFCTSIHEEEVTLCFAADESLVGELPRFCHDFFDLFEQELSRLSN